jgi:hypothetical protein
LEVANSLIDGYYLPKEKAWLPEIEEAITAIRQARALDKKAENARELGLDYGPVWDNLPSNKDVEAADGTKLYTTPPAPAPVPLTDEQIDALWEPAYRSVSRGGVFTPSSTEGKRAFARAIEAAHGITEKGQP